MSWFKIDDKLHSHKKVARLHGVAPMGLWALAGSWASNQETVGFIPEYIAERIDPDFAEHAAELVRVGLWEVDEIDGERGWMFHDWGDSNPTRRVLGESREKEREKKARQRAKGSASVSRDTSGRFSSPEDDGIAPSGTEIATMSPGDTLGTLPSIPTGSEKVVTAIPTRPDPTRPVKNSSRRDDSACADESADGFADFWSSYPRKDDKGAARRAWKAACKKASADMIVAGCRAYASQVVASGTERRFVKLPSTWLNAEAWANETTAPDPADVVPEWMYG